MTLPKKQASQPAPDLIQRLRGLICGFHEWRVESPEDGSYCLSRTHDDCANPERECREWLEREKKKIGSIFAGYVVKHHHVMTAKDKALAEAADALALLETRDVTKIMLDVVPGIDGMGEEVYAKTVPEVVDVLTRMGQQIEDLQGRSPSPKLTDQMRADLIADTREVFACGPQDTRDVIEYVDSWLQVQIGRAADRAARRYPSP